MTSATLPSSAPTAFQGLPPHALPAPTQANGTSERAPARLAPASPAGLQGAQAATAPALQESGPPTSAMEEIEHHPKWTLLAKLPTRLSAGIPLPHFKVKDLLSLRQGQLIRSQWESTSDVLLEAGGVHFSWSEFEVVEQRMAVRITRLA